MLSFRESIMQEDPAVYNRLDQFTDSLWLSHHDLIRQWRLKLILPLPLKRHDSISALRIDLRNTPLHKLSEPILARFEWVMQDDNVGWAERLAGDRVLEPARLSIKFLDSLLCIDPATGRHHHNHAPLIQSLQGDRIDEPAFLVPAQLQLYQLVWS